MRIQSGAGWETTGQEGEQAEGNAVGTAVWDRTGREMKLGSVCIGARKSKEKQEKQWRPDRAQNGLQGKRLSVGSAYFPGFSRITAYVNTFVSWFTHHTVVKAA